MITKGVRDTFGVREMFQNRLVVTAAQLSKVSPRTPGQPVRSSFSGRRADHWKTEGVLCPGPRLSAGDTPADKSFGLLNLHQDWHQPQGLTSCGSSGPRAYPLVLITGCPESQATCLSFHLTFFWPSTMLMFEALTLPATWMHPENTMLSERSQTQKDTQGVTPLRGSVQNR